MILQCLKTVEKLKRTIFVRDAQSKVLLLANFDFEIYPETEIDRRLKIILSYIQCSKLGSKINQSN